MKKIFVIDDDPDICFLLNKFLTKHGFDVSEARTAKRALEMLTEIHVDAVLCDYRLEGIDGNTMIRKIKEIQSVPVIIITAHNDVRIAVSAMKLGAFDFILKPLFPEEILSTLHTALKMQKAEGHYENEDGTISTAPKEDIPPAEDAAYIFGNSPVFKKIMKDISVVAPTDYSVIIYGESGSGKEVIAQEIHKKSNRRKFPFVAIDCGALSRELAGSELFGHEKGAFTGALKQKAGSFEIANGGTIFLDEIGNLSYDIQISLLRVVQERKMRRVGGNDDIALDVRIIVASNEKLWTLAQHNKFREDLYHRFNEFTIEVPPLRERREDIVLFANHFLKTANITLKKNITGFSYDVQRVLMEYTWPGNLRELKNVVKRAALLTERGIIEVQSLPFEITNFSKLQFEEKEPLQPRFDMPALVHQQTHHYVENNQRLEKKTYESSLKISSIDHEYEVILQSLKENNFNKSKVAKLLNIDRKTLYNKIALYQELVQKKNTNTI
jgi:two-component system response regulator HydG